MKTINQLREENLIIYEYVRGSHLYGINTENSDRDTGGVYIEPISHCLGLGNEYPETVADETNDNTFYSLTKFFRLLLGSNPNILESLFVPDNFVISKHPVMDIILRNRDKFLTKKCFGSFMGYSKTQLEKSYKLKSRIVNPVTEKLSPLDFVYNPYKQGSRKIKTWLEEKGLLQEHCGLTKVPHMECSYSLYYDWGAHWITKGLSGTYGDYLGWLNSGNPDSITYSQSMSNARLIETWEKQKTPKKYHGIVSESKSQEIRYSSIPDPEELPLTIISYNKDEYSRHCQQYREYVLWDKHHNKERFDLATKAMYDRKNACHAARLLNMGIEIARGEGLKIDRRNIDRELLLEIRRGEWPYEDILKYLKGKDIEMVEAMKNSTIPDEVDPGWLDKLMIEVRTKFYN